MGSSYDLVARSILPLPAHCLDVCRLAGTQEEVKASRVRYESEASSAFCSFSTRSNFCSKLTCPNCPPMVNGLHNFFNTFTSSGDQLFAMQLQLAKCCFGVEDDAGSKLNRDSGHTVASSSIFWDHSSTLSTAGAKVGI